MFSLLIEVFVPVFAPISKLTRFLVLVAKFLTSSKREGKIMNVLGKPVADNKRQSSKTVATMRLFFFI
jgi:hypothetical protein